MNPDDLRCTKFASEMVAFRRKRDGLSYCAADPDDLRRTKIVFELVRIRRARREIFPFRQKRDDLNYTFSASEIVRIWGFGSFHFERNATVFFKRRAGDPFKQDP